MSAGVYGWAADDVARIAVTAVRGHAVEGVERVRFVLFSERLLDAFRAALAS